VKECHFLLEIFVWKISERNYIKYNFKLIKLILIKDLEVYGHMRGNCLNANELVHITGHDDF
jgi:hypothetical protein